jgi:alpha-methylacyl-CoA racemase
MKSSLEISAGGERMGPLDGVQVVEIASLAPAPFGCMVLADLGADVLRVDRADTGGPDPGRAQGPLSRGRRSVQLNLKDADGIGLLLSLLEDADVLVEGFRPGVAERLGFGPEACARRNPRLVYARMTGWGQDGPLAPTAGHDIDYIAISGVLHPLGRAGEQPTPPVNLLGDFGGGGMLMALGILAALLERERSGLGQVVDAAMVDGSALLSTFLYGLRASGAWRDERGTNLLDTGAPFYDTYRTKDSKYVAVGALEAKFYAALLAGLGLGQLADGEPPLPHQLDESGWPVLRRSSPPRSPAGPGTSGAGVRGTDAVRVAGADPGRGAQPPAQRGPRHVTEVAGLVQPGPRRGSAAPRRARRAHRRSRARTPPPCSPRSATRPRRSLRCGPAPSLGKLRSAADLPIGHFHAVRQRTAGVWRSRVSSRGVPCGRTAGTWPRPAARGRSSRPRTPQRRGPGDPVVVQAGEPQVVSVGQRGPPHRRHLGQL